MSIFALVALVEFGVIVLLVGIAMGKHLHSRDLESQLEAATVRAEMAEAWCEHWEQQAEHAAEEAESAVRQHGELQELYVRLAREQLAANWPIVAHYAAMKRTRR